MYSTINFKRQQERPLREREHFDKMAKFYDENYGYNSLFVQYKIDKKIKDFCDSLNLAKKDKIKILELGCGTGEYTKKIAKLFPHSLIYGIDISGGVLKEALKKCSGCKNVHLKNASAYKTGFSDNSFDAVCAFYTLHHLDLEKTFLEARRVLKKRGLLFFAEPNILNPYVYLVKSNSFLKERVGDSLDEWGVNPLTVGRLLTGFDKVFVKTSEFLIPFGFSYKTLIKIDKVLSKLSKVPLLNLFGGTVVGVYRSIL